MMSEIKNPFFENILSVLNEAKTRAKTAVNISMVYAYFEIGKMIVEKAQHGKNRAAYGKKILKELLSYLTEHFGKGYSADNLTLTRRFWSVYSHDEIGETVFT